MAKSSTLTAALAKASQDVYRDSLRTALADLGPNVTVGEVIDSLDGTEYAEVFWAMTLREVNEAIGAAPRRATKAGGGAKAGGRAKAGGSAKAKPAMARTKFYTRTDEGREAIDVAMSDFLKAQSEPVGAEQIRATLGCTSAQIRQSLARLIDARKASKKGQKRSTRYAWKGRR